METEAYFGYIKTMNNSFVQAFHKILSKEFPQFLKKYLNIPILSRLKGVGLLCGTDWTPFFKNNFFYSRFDHSVGVALIIWHFTKDKAQTIAGLLHDVSTPAFSHVSDFRKGDALTQTATEDDNGSMLACSKELLECLAQDELTLEMVNDYHKYPIADNEVPQLSADRLEYMFPSGAALSGTWSLKQSFSLDEIEIIYNDLVICQNEEGIEELGFKTLSVAELYYNRVLDIAFFLQKNEDKMAMQFPATILNMAVKLGILKESDFFEMSEEEIISRLDELVKENSNATVEDALTENDSVKKLCLYFRTYRSFTSITRSKEPLPGHYCVKLQVKKRYINPLVVTGKQTEGLYEARRITELSETAKKSKEEFLEYVDESFGCVKLI